VTVAAVGKRIVWADLPADVRRGVETILGGPVLRTISQAGGFSPGTADRVLTERGRWAFVKAVSSDQNPDSPQMLRREADIVERLGSRPWLAPYVGRYDDGHWVALVLDDVVGTTPPVPWRADDIETALRMLARVATDLTPTPLSHLPTVVGEVAGLFGGWKRLREDPPPHLDPWIAQHLDDLVRCVAETVPRLGGSTVVHLDVRADNLLIRPDGSMVLVDWPWAAIGPDWLDRFELILNIDFTGGHDVEVITDRHLGHVPPELITGTLAGFCAFFTDEGRRPDPAGLPTVRAFQRAQAATTLAWLKRRWPAGLR
jgi:hypothetical protein